MTVKWASVAHTLSGGHRDTAGISLRRREDRREERKMGERVQRSNVRQKEKGGGKCVMIDIRDGAKVQSVKQCKYAEGNYKA